MPFDEGNRCWKIRIYDQSGVSTGFVMVARYEHDSNGCESLVHYGDRTWRGKPRPQHFETLYRWKGCDDRVFYFVLIHFGHEFTDNDYGQELPKREAARWLLAEGYELPDDLQGYSESVDATAEPKDGQPEAAKTPLTEDRLAVWNRLENRAATAKELAIQILDDHSMEAAIRKRISAIRKTGREIKNIRGIGYFRPDTPPPEFGTVSQT